MDDTHTPGPWKYNEGNPTRIIGPGEETVAAVYGGMVGDQVQLANAQLIAAAPSIYAYVRIRASNGDKDALNILANLNMGG